jgi:histidine triad (HIT) family protein
VSGRTGAQAGCGFCRVIDEDDPEVVLLRRAEVVAFLDIRPLFPGHLLVCPRTHHRTLDELPTDLITPLFSAVQVCQRALEQEMGAEGTFVAANNRVSQSVPHLHVHVVPRSRGDGLRGFFWPRNPYEDDTHLARTRRRLRATIEQLTRTGP